MRLTNEIPTLTIHQPHSWAIIHGRELPCDQCTTGTPTDARPWVRENCPQCGGRGVTPVKRVENRGWFTPYRGPLLIHAGKFNAKWYGDDLYPGQPRRDKLAFGAIIGVAYLRGCVLYERAPRLHGDPYASGPYCWLLENPRALAQPVKMNGSQGIWYMEAGNQPEILALLEHEELQPV